MREVKIKPMKAWAAYSDGKLLTTGESAFYGGAPRLWIFRTRKGARTCAEDVRAVLITPIRKAKVK